MCASVSQIAPGVPLPQGIQGHDDENWPMRLLASPSQLLARYTTLAQLQPGIRRYNMYWSSFEVAPSMPSLPASCAEGFDLVPSSEAERVEQGFHRFHCYQSSSLTAFDQILGLDQLIGAQTAAIIYSAPSWAQDPNCTGFVFGKDVIKAGCAPVDTALDDFEDFVNLLVVR